MKKVILSFAIVLGLSLTSMTVYAQHRPMKKDKMQLSEKLDLSKDQEQKLESLNKDFRTKIKELRAKSDLSKEERRAEMKKLGEQHRTNINGILSAEQQAKMKEFKEKAPKMRANREFKGKDQRMKHRHHNMAQMKHRDPFNGLNLTDEQKQKIKSLNEGFRTKNKELAEQHRAEINKVLTPEQQAKMKEKREKFEKKDRRPDRKPEMKKGKAEKDKA